MSPETSSFPSETMVDSGELLECLAREFEDNKAQLLFFIRRYARNHHEAEDVLQETWLHIQHGAGTFDREKPFLPWAKRICYRIVVDRFRKNHLRPKEFVFSATSRDDGRMIDVPDPNTSDERESRDELVVWLRDHIGMLFSRMKPRARESIQEYLDGKEPDDIARDMNLKGATIRWRIADF